MKYSLNFIKLYDILYLYKMKGVVFMESLVFMSIINIVAAFIPLFYNSVPAWAQRYHEWSTSSSKEMKLNNELNDRLKKSLSVVRGQDLAIGTIIDSICGWSESKKNNFDYKSGGLVIHMAGTSGTGKSMTANILANELSKDATIKISYSSINTGDQRSCAEQLFGSYQRLSVGKVSVKCNTDYSAQLMHNSKVVVQIDEFDKFMMRDDSLQALLWDVADTGRLKVDKDTYIDCSNTIFILTSNASRESLKMKIDKIKTDDSDSLESVDFKQAFLNRITNVYFENFSQEIYKEILLMRLKPIQEYYLKKFNITINFNDDVIETISNELVNMKTGGARNIGIFTRKLYSAMNSFKIENNISESHNENQYSVDAFYKDEEFKICCE